nr:IclR family transcriptional regulator C-terminal domain-containing protein [Sulfitobacter alexandrii]
MRSLKRGVSVLQTINQNNGLKPSEIAAATGIPRASVYRLLETLEEMELVIRDRSSEKWRPTLHTKSLSSGFRDEDWVCQVAIPKMIQLGRRILWPIDLMTMREYRMEVRESTHSISPYAVNHGMVGRKLPIPETASGRAHLAFLPPEESEEIVRIIAEERNEPLPLILRDGPLARVLEQTRQLGVGFRREDYVSETESLSAPIYHHGKVVAAITIIWASTAMRFDRAYDLYHQDLLATAGAISGEISALAGVTQMDEPRA